MNPVLFDIRNVTKIFGKTKETQIQALKNIHLKINKKEFVAIIGPSGSGKSTLLNVMSGFEIPTSGSVFILGKKVNKMSESALANFRRDHVGFVFQAYNLIPVLTVKENIEYVMILQRISEKKRNLRIHQFLEAVGLKGTENRYPSELSGGQQQRVAIARAMVTHPDIVIADEPTANLDSKNAIHLIEMMRSLHNQYGTTFIFSTHDPMIMKKAKRLVTLKDGTVVHDQV